MKRESYAGLATCKERPDYIPTCLYVIPVDQVSKGAEGGEDYGYEKHHTLDHCRKLALPHTTRRNAK